MSKTLIVLTAICLMALDLGQSSTEGVALIELRATLSNNAPVTMSLLADTPATIYLDTTEAFGLVATLGEDYELVLGVRQGEVEAK